jgi:AcrR family transcriptional regulator
MTDTAPTKEAYSREEPSKGERTREHILNTALTLFAQKGYSGTTLRDIAKSADVSLGLAYRYFASKEEFVIALYDRLIADLEDEVAQLPAQGKLADRVEQIMRADLKRCAPYRDAFAALAGVGLLPDSEAAVLGKQTAPIRERVWRVFYLVVTGASDRLTGKVAEDVATLLYAAHLLLILFWLQDRTDSQKATSELLTLAGDVLARYRFLLRIPQVAQTLSRFAAILTPLLR